MVHELRHGALTDFTTLGMLLNTQPALRLPIALWHRDSGRPVTLNAHEYKGRNVIERGYCLIKQWRALATRYDEHARTYRGGLVLAAILTWAKVERLAVAADQVSASSPPDAQHTRQHWQGELALGGFRPIVKESADPAECNLPLPFRHDQHSRPRGQRRDERIGGSALPMRE